ncbi:hypothetical protein AVEN_48027-1 [Araneus ventricosus]|uniref:Core Histone H2A/H2B/H3 domain-containing protein n=1 Tax=Araneus ventricosus TaxID=182803 RepID=A0A4Y2FTL8_ARAVE|nr:hypothetical protein AVEN_48027-1 [Araneus ventricosus]
MDFSPQETVFKVKDDEPIPITSTHDFNPVQWIRRKKQRREELSFKTYILRMKKIVFPGLKLSSNALEDLDNLLSNIYQMYCSEFQLLSSHTKIKTLSDKDVESATKLCIPGNLKIKAMDIGRRSVFPHEVFK